MKSARSRLGLIAIFLPATLLPNFALSDAPKTTTIIVVRHAEKQTTVDDPGLTLAGEERSHRLRDLTLEAGVTAVFATQYRRTQATVQPLAAALGLEVGLVDARDSEALATKILSEHRGGIVVVAGHSNTVPGIVAALGAPEPGSIDESQYSDLFVVMVPESGTPTALRLQY